MINLANKVKDKTFYQHLLFIFATLITLGLVGYYFGTFDQVSHLPFLKKTVDPTLYPNDHYFDLRSSHYSYFWLLFIPFYQLHLLEPILFIIHLLTVYFTYWMIWSLSWTLFKNNLASLLSVLAFIFPHLAFGGFSLFEFSLINRTFVLPFLILSINLYLNRRYWLSFLILGLMFNLHALSVNFVLAMFLFDSLIRFRQIGIKTIVKNILVFIVFALPVIVWKSKSSMVDFSINWSWYQTIKNGMLNNIFDLMAISPPLIYLTLGGIASLIVFFYVVKDYQHPFKQAFLNFFWAGIIILFIQIITSYFFPITIIVQFQIIRIGLLLLFFSYLFTANYISRQAQNNRLSIDLLMLLLFGLILSISPIFLLLPILIAKYNLSKNLYRMMSVVVIVSFFINLIIVARLHIWQPGINIYPNRLKGYRVQLWAKNHTPKNAVFIVPPHLWWFYSLDWRVVSERSTVVTLSELLEAAFEPRYVDYWLPRFNDIAPGAYPNFKGNTMENFAITKTAFYSLTEEDFKRLATKYRTKYLVVEQPYRYNFPVVYQDNEFLVYQLNFF